MDVQRILEAIDEHVTQLQQARALLSQAIGGTVLSTATATIGKRRSRLPLSQAAAGKPRGKRKISEEGRARIVMAQKKRWAKTKQAVKTALVSPVTKKTGSSATKAGSKKAAGTKAASIVRKKTPTQQAPPAKKSSRAKKAASAKKIVQPQKAAVTIKPRATNKTASSPKESQEPRKNLNLEPDNAGSQLEALPTAAPTLTENTDTTT